MARQYYYVKPGTRGWYAGSITQGSNLTDQLVGQMTAQNQVSSSSAQNPVNQIVSALTGGTNSTSGTAKSGSSHILLLAALGVAIWKVI
ncbi:MAG: hypothetical protein ACRD18_02600 [Terriglobia bacterium]